MRPRRSARPRARALRRQTSRPDADRVSRLLVVDEHPIVGIALKALLTDEADFVVQASTELGAAERAIADGTADIIVSEIAFAGASRGLDLLRAHSSRPPIVLFTGLNHPGVFQAALDARAEGVVSKAAPLTEVVDAIRIVAAGGTAVGPDVLRAARRARRRPAPRELALIAEVATGATNLEIAERLSIRRPTVEAVLRRLFDRYSVTNRTALIGIAHGEGWLLGLAA